MLKVNPPGRTFSLMAAAVPCTATALSFRPRQRRRRYQLPAECQRRPHQRLIQLLVRHRPHFLAHRCDPELLRDQVRDADSSQFDPELKSAAKPDWIGTGLHMGMVLLPVRVPIEPNCGLVTQGIGERIV